LQAEELAPDNRAILLQTGECLVALKRYDEAFSRFFKAEYNAPQSKRAWRAIAWCSFMVDNHDRARTYYEKLLATPERTMQDWLNAAHVELVTRNNGKAIEYYRKAAVLCKDDEEFSSNLMADSKILVAKGISTNDLILVRDIVS
jgi:tetratricopeptide (TPR) repeat protein